MRIVLAPDKFKGSLTGLEFCKAVSQGILAVMPEANIVFCPLTDGGDGTIEVINYYLKGETKKCMVKDPFFRPVNASYLFSKSTKTAFIEMAEASGHKLLKKEELDCKNATTYGTGQLILDAISNNAKTIILGVGGSATNDCGIGMATALGYKFLNKNGEVIVPIGKNLSIIVKIDDSQVIPKLKEIIIKIACDVSNPLYGKQGAAHIYARQKGATEADVMLLNKGLEKFSKILDSKFNVVSQQVKGAGAAGGMGIGAKLFLNGELIPGVELIKGLANFKEAIKDADWVITGEGQLDKQTLSGKTINGVISETKITNVKVAAFCGKVSLNEFELKAFGVYYADEVMAYANSIEDAMVNGKQYVTKMAEEFAKNLI